jgi:small multidrug resistance family-3 protein
MSLFESICKHRYHASMEYLLLILAAILEVGGDAIIRHGLQRKGVVLMFGGVIVLGVYGFMVNMTKLDFGRLMGIYIVLFFVVSQVVSVVIFKERVALPVLVGGAMIVCGGVLMMVWKH